MSKEEIISLCQYAENGDKYFITCFGNVTETIQPCWKINDHHCVLEDQKHFDRIYTVILETLMSNMQIDTHRHKRVITATVTMFKMPFQLDRWHHGNITVEMFIGHLQNCSCPYNIYLVNVNF